MPPSRKKHKASKRPADMSIPIDEEKFITSASRRLYQDECKNKNIVHELCIENVPKVRRYFALLSLYILENFLNIKENEYEESVRLFYPNLTIPDVAKGTKLILCSNLLGTPIEFSLSTLFEPSQ